MQTCNWSSGMWLLPLIVCPSPSWKRLSKVADSMRYEEHERSSSICLQLACLHFSWIMLPLYRPNWPGLELRDLWTIKQISNLDVDSKLQTDTGLLWIITLLAILQMKIETFAVSLRPSLHYRGWTLYRLTTLSVIIKHSLLFMNSPVLSITPPWYFTFAMTHLTLAQSSKYWELEDWWSSQ